MAHLESWHYFGSRASPFPRWRSVDALVAGMAGVVMLCLGLVVLPRRALPLQDEVFYVGPTVWFANTGELLVPAAVLPTFIGLAGWGAAFVKLFGGDFVTLRLASLVASAISAVAFYGLVRELGFDRGRSILALGVLILNPLFLSNSVLFLTDPLLLCLVLGSLYAGVLGLRRGQASLLLAAGLLAGGAFLTRQVGLAVAVALLCGLGGNPRLRHSRRLWLALLIPPAVAVVAYLIWASGQAESQTNGYLASSLHMWAQEVQPTHFGRRLNWVVAYCGLFVTPWLVMLLPALGRRMWRLDRRGATIVVGSLLFVGIGFGYEWTKGIRHFPYLDHTLDPRGLFMKGFTDVALWPHEEWLIVGTVVAWAAAGIVLGLGIDALVRSRRHWWSHPHLPVYMTGGLLALGSVSLRVPNDRYFLAWLPFALIAALAVTASMRPSRALAAAVLGLGATINVMLMADYSERAALRWEVARQLVHNGIPANDIAASWEWQWWWGYWRVYHVGEKPPDALDPAPGGPDAGSTLRAVEQSFDRRREVDHPYRIDSVPEPGYQVQEVYGYRSPLFFTQRYLYVLVAVPDQSGKPSPESLLQGRSERRAE